MKKPNPPTPTTTPRMTEASGSFAGIDMPFKQVAAFETIMSTTGGEEFDVTAKVISIGLFALGLDGGGDYCLGELTDALYGKNSNDGNAVQGAIADAGAEAWGRYSNVTRENRRRASVVGA